MRKSLKLLSYGSLWLAVAAIWAHMIIPHDHHIIDNLADQEQNCPASNHENGNKPEYPVHCHAFNDLASEKAKSFHISQNITDGFIGSAWFSEDLIYVPSVPGIRITDFQTPFQSSSQHSLFLLRAPPYSA
jgi:hypothetical protein